MWEKFLFSVSGKVASSLLLGIVKYRREEKKRKELEEKLSFANRGFMATLIIYMIGFMFSVWVLKWGFWGIILVLLGYFGQFNNLNEAKQYVPIKREMTLSILSLIGLVITYFLYIKHYDITYLVSKIPMLH